MLEKPDLPDETIVTCLRDEYGLRAARIVFLPLGADLNTAVYRVDTDDETPYFVKLRSGTFDETSVALPKHLCDQGIPHIIAPLATNTRRLWADLNVFKLILYPYIEGKSGFEIAMSDRHWTELGAALNQIHRAALPPVLVERIRREDYSPKWREIVKTHLARVEKHRFDNPTAVKMAAFLKIKRNDILDLFHRADRLARELQTESPGFVLCHSDAHAANVLIGNDGAFFIVDWDEPIYAAKERDLMFVGAGIGGIWNTAREESLFYAGYGETDIDLSALAYYRVERIVQDIAVYCEQIFLTDKGGTDREQSFEYLKSNFLPNSTMDIAIETETTARAAAGKNSRHRSHTP